MCKKNNNDWVLEEDNDELFLEPEEDEELYESAMEP